MIKDYTMKEENNNDCLNNYCLNKEQCNCIFYISFLSLFSCIYGLYKGHYDIAIFSPGGVFLTSILNWCNPLYDWRRYLDISYVVFAYIYATIRVFGSTYELYFHTFMAISIISFIIGCIFAKMEYYWYSTIFHMGIHIFANIANFIVFSGDILPINKISIFNYFLMYNKNNANVDNINLIMQELYE